MTYRVKRGDTLSSIARSFHTTVASLRSWNRLKSDRLMPGDRLTVYTTRADDGRVAAPERRGNFCRAAPLLPLRKRQSASRAADGMSRKARDPAGGPGLATVPGVLATLLSAALAGIDGRIVRVEVDVSPGLPSFTVVGLPDASVRESRDRVRTAIRNSDFEFPWQHITINLAPPDVRKEGAASDLPIALGILAATGALPSRSYADIVVVGALSLDGAVRPTGGVLPVAMAASRRRHRRRARSCGERRRGGGCRRVERLAGRHARRGGRSARRPTR